MTRIFMMMLLTLVLSTTVFTQAPSPAESTTARVDKLFAQWDKPDTPGCALSVIKDGQIIYKRAYGTGNLELAVPLSSSSIFNVGSISKQFTAMSILMLAQQGKLSLDDDVRKYIPEVPNFGSPITLRHLIHHTSGLRDYLEMLEMAGWRTGDITTEQDILDMVSRQRSLNHKPGDEFVYTNTGYVLLAIIVKRVTGHSLREFAEANIFTPLGMANTHFYDDHTVVIKDLVDGYLKRPGGDFMKWMPADDHVGSSNLYTSVEDLARWDQNFYDKKVGEAVLKQMLAVGTLNDGSKLEYAAGVFVVPYRGLQAVVHNGSTLGYQGNLIRFPNQHFSVALLCNVRGNNPEALSRRVSDIYLADQLTPVTTTQSSPIVAPADSVKLSDKELSRVAGLYWNAANDTVRRVYVKEGKLMYFRAAGNESELAPLGDYRFLMLGVRNRVEITFKSPRPRAPLQMYFSESGGKPTIQEAVKPASYAPAQLMEFAGKYYSPELDTTYSITPKDDKLLFQTGNWGDFLLSTRFLDSFANPAEMGSITFTRDSNKRVSGFVIRSGKVRNLSFTKIKG